jgi:hypothetical protein
MDRSSQALGRAYQQFCQELSNVLYEEDPALMGKSIGAPLDEYGAEAARLAAALKNAQSSGEIERVVVGVVRQVTPLLLQRIERAVTKFRWRTQ